MRCSQGFNPKAQDKRSSASWGRSVALVILVLAIPACAPPEPSQSAAPKTETASNESAANGTQNGWLVDRTEELGIDFRHQDGRSGERYYIETVASGGGWLDADGDGDLDLYLVNGAATPGSPNLREAPRNALYENREGRFVDITDEAGVGDPGYGMGLCAGDYDADGHLDFLVTNYGPDRLYRGLGHLDGSLRFEETSEVAGVAGERWGTNCTFTDVDGDGDLDLYVANYVDFSFEENPRCGDVARDVWSYCRPIVFSGQNDYLYINQGDGTFREEGAARGITQEGEDRGFGVIASDLSGDDAPDLLVANDGTFNRFYVNDGQGFFTDRALASGLASNRSGQVEAGMGLALADATGDGRQDLLVTNYSFETNTFYENQGDLFFEDRTVETGLGSPSYLRVGWGVAFLDFDNDGDLDAAVANGHVMDTIDLFEEGIGYPQPNALFLNDGSGRFEDASALAGPALTQAQVSRALAVGDWNDDGRLDLLITNTNDGIRLLENRHNSENHWIGFRLVGAPENPLAIGARVVLDCAGERVGLREVRSGGSVLAQHDLRLHFGLGDCSGPLTANIFWPDGQEQAEEVERGGAYVTLSHNTTTTSD